MAFTYAQEDGYLKLTESIVVPANTSGGAVDTSGSSFACTGNEIIFMQGDEETNCDVKLQYTMDTPSITHSGVGQDPSAALSSSTQTWYDAKATDENAETAGGGDNILEAFIVPKNARFVKVVYTAAHTYAGSTEATELWIDMKKSDIGFSVGGIGADPS